MDQETPKVDPQALKAAVDDLWGQLRKEWGDYPRDRSTVEGDDDTWEWFQGPANAQYGQADEGLKKAIEKAFDKQSCWGYRRFRALRDLPASPDELSAARNFFGLFPRTNSQAQDQTAGKTQALQSVECSCLWIAKEESSDSILRFYSDRKVISVSSTDSPAEIACWFKKPYSLWGTYRVTGSAIKFYLMNYDTTYEYEGALEGSAMLVKEFCPENNYHGVHRFELAVFGETEDKYHQTDAVAKQSTTKEAPPPLQLAVNNIEVATSFPAYFGERFDVAHPHATLGELTYPAKLLKITFSVKNTSQENASFKLGDVQLAIGPYLFDDFAAVGYDDKLCAVPSEKDRQNLKKQSARLSPAATTVLSFAFPVPDPSFKRGVLLLSNAKSVPFALPRAPGELTPYSESALHDFVSKAAAWLRRKHSI